jgi:DNA-binding response OmpR family regulator
MLELTHTDNVHRRSLVIEDNQDIAHLLELHLGDISRIVDVAYDGAAGLKLAAEHSYDIIILDLMLPNVGGLEICRTLRTRGDHTPILMLTAKSSELDRVLGLEIGADDYLTKPFSIPELIARVKAILRRVEHNAASAAERPQPVIQIDGLTIDAERRQVLVDGKRVELTAKEFDLLWHFAQQPGRVFSRAQLLDQVWGYSFNGYEHTVNSHINRLRSKLERDPANPCYIRTVWGVGYSLAEPQKEAGDGDA